LRHTRPTNSLDGIIPRMAKKPKPVKAKTGPKPELFKIEGMTWKEAVKKSLTKKKPAGGWPK
jgi:hypothetical protein